MTPVMGTVSAGLPACLHKALLEAQQLHEDCALCVCGVPDGYSLMAARGGRVTSVTVPECIVNNHELEAVMRHYFEELTKALP